MAIAGRLVDRFGPALVLTSAFLVGALCTAALGACLTSVVLAASATAAVGVFVGIAGSGSIALSSLIYPQPMRATGIGWAMAMGRGGQVVAPMVAGQILSGGGDASDMLLVMAAALSVAAVFVVLLGRCSATPTYAPAIRTEPGVAVH
jgi:AAHS family 4-hydroxybenzoate transporter-like MFS transporter